MNVGYCGCSARARACLPRAVAFVGTRFGYLYLLPGYYLLPYRCAPLRNALRFITLCLVPSVLAHAALPFGSLIYATVKLRLWFRGCALLVRRPFDSPPVVTWHSVPWTLPRVLQFFFPIARVVAVATFPVAPVDACAGAFAPLYLRWLVLPAFAVGYCPVDY